MAYSSVPKTKRDGTITFSDNGAETLTVSIEAGDLSVDIPGEGEVLILDRGRITDPPLVRYTDDQPMTGSFTAYLRDLSDGAATLLEELLTQTGYVASNWVSTMGANAEVFTVDMVWTIEGTDHGDPADHTATFLYCALRGGFSEGDPNVINVSFTSYDLRPSVT